MFWNKRLNKEDLIEYQAMIRLTGQETFKYYHIKGNTALIPKGQFLAEQQFAVIGVLNKAVEEWIGQLLAKYGCKKGFQYLISGTTGKITKMAPTNEVAPQTIKQQAK